MIRRRIPLTPNAARRAMPETDPAEARRMVRAWWRVDHPTEGTHTHGKA